jgi:endonuclease/exonuclease/phosphatase family metal-dependent hydrolase
MDHVGKTARIEAAKLVMQKTQELGKRLPAILTGDFNVDQTSPAYDTLARSGVFQDSYEMAHFRYAENGTFNAWSTTSFSTARIDHIFLTQQFKVERYAVLTDTYRVPIPDDAQDISGDKPAEVKLTKYESHNPSDHFPVRIIVDLN